MITSFFGYWHTLVAPHASVADSVADSVAEVPVAAEPAAIAGQYRGTPMPLTQPKAAVRSPKQLNYRGTSYTR